MKWLSIFAACIIVLVAVSAETSAQTRRYTSTRSTVVYYVDLTTRPTVTRGTESLGPFTPSGVQTSANGGSGYATPVAINELTAMNMSFIVKAQSLPPRLYASFSKVANDMRKSPERSAMLRRLIYELPSRMEGTQYIPPSPKSIMQAMRKVVYSTDAQVAAYWRSR